MNFLTEADIKQDIKTKNFKNIYFIFGDEHYLIKFCVKNICNAVVTQNHDFNLNMFNDNMALEDIFNAAEALPFFDQYKCVNVCDLAFEKLSTSEFNNLLAFVKDPPKTTVMVFWFETVEINQKKLSEKAKKFMLEVEKVGGSIVAINKKSQAELVKMLCNKAAKKNCHLASAEARYMIESCSDDINILLNELEKICAFTVSGIISKNTIDQVCCKTVENSVYNISKAIATKDIKRALQILDDLYFMKTEPITILAVLAGTYVDITRVKAAVNTKQTVDSIIKDFGYAKNLAFRLTNAERLAKNISDKQLLFSLNSIAECDRLLKSSKTNTKIAIENLIIKLVYILSKGDSI